MKVIKLPLKVKKPILACGADMKGAFALAQDDEAFLVDDFGDLSDPDNLEKYDRSIKTHIEKLGIKPAIVACDFHPNYFSTRFAENLQLNTSNLRLCKIQHHEAHVASAIVDNNIKGDVIGVAFDGTGYGSDGNIWGGEFFIGGLKKFKRIAHLKYIAMPGGEKAVKEPWRMAVSYLYDAFGNNLPSLVKRWKKKDVAILKAMIDKNINSPRTSSAGRLFDAAGSLILERDIVLKEAELPIELEKLVSGEKCGTYKFRFYSDGEMIVVDIKDTIKCIVKSLSGKVKRSEISCKFHNTIADIITKTVLRLSKKFKVKQACLSGGVFQNRYLTAKVVELLEEEGIRVYTHSNITTNDSGIPVGQIVITNARAICA